MGPNKAGSPERLARLEAFFQQPDLIWLELERSVVELATELRVRLGLRTPDALQAACCLQLGPGHVMLTGDRGFARVEGLNIDWASSLQRPVSDACNSFSGNASRHPAPPWSRQRAPAREAATFRVALSGSVASATTAT